MRGLLLIGFAALLNGSAAFASEGPCSLAGRDEVERALGGAVAPVPVDEIGEETAPYCLWATAERRASIKLTIWSEAELPVLDLADGESYFMKLEAEARGRVGFAPLDGFGTRAFGADGTIVMLKTGRVIVLDFAGVRPQSARWFATLIAPRL